MPSEVVVDASAVLKWQLDDEEAVAEAIALPLQLSLALVAE